MAGCHPVATLSTSLLQVLVHGQPWPGRGACGNEFSECNQPLARPAEYEGRRVGPRGMPLRSGRFACSSGSVNAPHPVYAALQAVVGRGLRGQITSRARCWQAWLPC